MKTLFFTALSFLLPVVAAAQTETGGTSGSPLNTDNAEALVDSLIRFIGVLINLLFAVAFLVFIFGIFKYFILGGANEEKRQEGKQLALWGIIGFFVMVSVWGLVNFIDGTLDLNNENVPTIPVLPGVSGTRTTAP